MPKPEIGVHSRDGSTVLQWRIKAPKDLRHLYTSEYAHRCSLGTSSLPEANRKAARLRAEWLDRFERERERVQEGATMLDVLTPDHGRAIAQRALEVLLEKESTRLDASMRRGILRPIRELGVLGMESFGSDLGWSFNGNTPGAPEAFAHYYQTIETAMQARFAELPPAPPKLAKKYRLRDVLPKWKESKRRKEDTEKATERALTLFEQWAKNPELDKITREMGSDFRAYLLSLDTSSKTAKSRLAAVNGLIQFAFEALGWLQFQPWSGLTIDSEVEAPRRVWRPEELVRFFHTPLFQAYQLPTVSKSGKAAAYWIPLLGLFTGRRISQLATIQAEEVELGDLPLLHFPKAKDRNIKTEASVGSVPVHSELIRLGFLEYVRCIQANGPGPLWPDLPLRSEKAGGYFSQWFNETRKAPPISFGDQPDFHCLRHTVSTCMTEEGTHQAIQDRITGHATTGSSGAKTYAHPVKILRTAVESIHYPGLELPRVFQVPDTPNAS